MARAIKLINAPVGLFDIDGVLVLKTEYSTQHEDGSITPDCYIVDSGEYFWGGVDSVEERNNLMVTPIDMPTLTPPNESLTQPDLDSMDYDKVWIDYEDGTGEWALVCRGYIYSIDTLEGTGFDFVDYMRGERLEPHGYKVYRRPPEGEEDKL